jgi:hypothetical protein
MKSKQSDLNGLVREAVGYTLTATIRIAVEKIAEEIAKEILNDPDFRAFLKAATQRYAEQAMKDLLR